MNKLRVHFSFMMAITSHPLKNIKVLPQRLSYLENAVFLSKEWQKEIFICRLRSDLTLIHLLNCYVSFYV